MTPEHSSLETYTVRTAVVNFDDANILRQWRLLRVFASVRQRLDRDESTILSGTKFGIRTI